MSFKNIIGNNNAKKILTKSLDNNTILHSYMFVGNDGIGKKLTAMQFAKMILCEDYNSGEECNRCKSCIEFDSNNNPDFNIIEPDGKIIKIEQIRELQTKIIEKPIISSKKVYIIDNAHLMTKEAQNCLLKTLEEPPEYIVIILIVSNESRILTTIKSRCMKVNFENINDDEVRKFLQNECGVENISSSILRLCNGSIGRCFQIKERLDDYIVIEKALSNFNVSITKFISSLEILYKGKDNINDYLEYINVILYEYAIKNKAACIKFINSIKIVETTKERLLSNSNYDMCIDYLLFNIWEEINEENSWSKV